MTNRERTITVLAAASLDALEAHGADVEDVHFETVAEAKRRARYLLTEAYRAASESGARLGYARVLVDGECRYDCFQEAK
jgi:hypothetical protein